MTKANKTQTTKALFEVLHDIKNKFEFKYSSYQLQSLHVKYGTQLNSYLSTNGYIDENGKLLKDFNIDKFIKDFTVYSKNKQRLYRSLYKEKKTPFTKIRTKRTYENESHIIPTVNLAFDIFEDHQLVDELRKRGYEVTAKKTVITEL